MTEIWKDVVGYEGLYQVSNLGRVKSLPKLYGKSLRGEKIIAPVIDKQGYVVMTLRKNGSRKYGLVHRLVAEAFLTNTYNYPQVNHINGDKTDNRVNNLEWCTAKENINHAFSIGLSRVGKGEYAPMYGKHHSENTKRIISEKSRNAWIKRKSGV